MAEFYASQTKMVLEQVPAGGLFVAETEELSSVATARGIAHFLHTRLNITRKRHDKTLLLHGPHGYSVEGQHQGHKKRFPMFQSLPTAYIAKVIAKTVCAKLEGLFDKHVTSFGSRPAWCMDGYIRRFNHGYRQNNSSSLRASATSTTSRILQSRERRQNTRRQELSTTT